MIGRAGRAARDLGARLNAPLITISDLGHPGQWSPQEISERDLLLIAADLLLVGKSTHETSKKTVAGTAEDGRGIREHSGVSQTLVNDLVELHGAGRASGLSCRAG
jgi:hypothetical protein